MFYFVLYFLACITVYVYNISLNIQLHLYIKEKINYVSDYFIAAF